MMFETVNVLFSFRIKAERSCLTKWYAKVYGLAILSYKYTSSSITPRYYGSECLASLENMYCVFSTLYVLSMSTCLTLFDDIYTIFKYPMSSDAIYSMFCLCCFIYCIVYYIVFCLHLNTLLFPLFNIVCWYTHNVAFLISSEENMSCVCLCCFLIFTHHSFPYVIRKIYSMFCLCVLYICISFVICRLVVYT